MLQESKALKLFTPEDDRPRERAKKLGFQALSVAELLAILMGSGAQGMSVVELCQKIYADHGMKLNRMSRLGYRDLMRYRGVGEVKALVILAALELGRRYQLETLDDQQTQITSSRIAYEYLRNCMGDLNHEEAWMLILNRAKMVTGRVRLSSGGTTMTAVDVKMVLKEALQSLADGIVLAHNHPSDNASPSKDDDILTHRVGQGCRAVGIELVDHIIVCRGGRYYSYCDHGKIDF